VSEVKSEGVSDALPEGSNAPGLPDGQTSKRTRRSFVRHCTARVAAALLGMGIGRASIAADTSTAPSRPLPPGASPPAVAAQRILVVGDSLSAEYGLARGSGWVALLQQRLQKDKLNASVVNASISGDTTSGGRARFAPLLTGDKPTHVVLELGANDALRGLSLAAMKDNLAAMAKAAKEAGARVVIVGMQVPPNYGRKYSEDFAAVFTQVAREQNAALVPFLLAGVADIDKPESMFQPDRIHPLATAHPTMLENVWKVLRPLLK
jgi:acyl-CoA thioesterase-1